MLVLSQIAPMFATNCWVIAPARRGECIIVDPGAPDISAEVELLIQEAGLKPVAALLTHGHLDHTLSIKPLADGYQIPAYIHAEDRRFVANPAALHGSAFAPFLEGLTLSEPADLRELRNAAVLDLLGMKITAIHAPGHTAGSMVFIVNDEILLSGDVLFAGSIGRTDLPTGSASEMSATLQKKILPLADELRVLPGHGVETTMKFERKNNPYLKELQL